MNTLTSDQGYSGEDFFCVDLLSTAEGYRSGHSTIDMLSDDELLCIFDSYRRQLDSDIWPWADLVHVCRRWRRIIFGCPSYLKLYLICKSKTDVQAMPDIWPVLPLIFHANLDDKDGDEDDIIGALEHRDRMAGIHVRAFECSQFTLEKCVASMQEPFPVLTSLGFKGDDSEEMTFVTTDAFLGGSAPLLQRIHLGGIRFPGLPKLLSSTSDLVYLTLEDFPITGEGHIPPDAMAACLSLLTKLRYLTITFPLWYPEDQLPPPPTHAVRVLPALTNLLLEGPHEYLEDLVGRIDAPVLTSGKLEFYHVPAFDTPRVPQFIHRTKMFELPCKEVQVQFRKRQEYIFHRVDVHVTFLSSISPGKFYLSFPCSFIPALVETGLRALVATERIFAQWPSLVSHVEFLELGDNCCSEERWGVRVAPHWLGFLPQFSAVQTLHFSVVGEVPLFAHMLGGLEGERATKLLPALRTIELACPELRARAETLCVLVPFLVAREEAELPVIVNVVPYRSANWRLSSVASSK